MFVFWVQLWVNCPKRIATGRVYFFLYQLGRISRLETSQVFCYLASNNTPPKVILLCLSALPLCWCCLLTKDRCIFERVFKLNLHLVISCDMKGRFFIASQLYSVEPVFSSQPVRCGQPATAKVLLWLSRGWGNERNLGTKERRFCSSGSVN